MEELNEILLQTYLENLNFLERFAPELFKKIVLLGQAIEEGKYEEKWALEYIEDGEYLDIKNLKTSEYVYQGDIFKFASNIADEVQVDDSSSFKLLTKIQNGRKLDENSQYDPIKKLVKHINDNTDEQNYKFRKIYKYIFIGTGLGTHISEIYKKIMPLDILIIEPDLEIFRLSLFVTNYSLFATGDHRLYLSVGKDQFHIKEDLEKFYYYRNEFNFMIKYNQIFSSYNNILEDIKSSLLLLKKDIDVFLQMLSTRRVYLGYKEKYKFISFSKMENERSLLENKQALVLSGGHSLDLHLDWIKTNQDRFYIIAINLMANKLLENGIKADIVISADAGIYVYETLEKIKDSNFFKDTIFMPMSHVEQRAFELFDKNNVYLIQGVPLFENMDCIERGENVGITAVSVAKHLGFETVYTIGIDGSFDSKTGKYYSNGSHFSVNMKEKQKEQEDKDKSSIDIYDVVEVKGNLLPTVMTNRAYAHMNYALESVLKKIENISKNTKLYNLSNGAYIQGLTPLNITEVQLPQEKKNINELHKLLRYDDIENCTIDFKNEYNIVLMIQKMLDMELKNDVSSIDEILQIKLKLYSTVLKSFNQNTNRMIKGLFLKYFLTSDKYFTFYLSLDKTYEYNELNGFKNVWLIAFSEFLNDILYILEDEKGK